MSDGSQTAPESPLRILISGWAGAGNIGDELLTRALITRVRSAGAVPVVASRDPGATSVLHEGVEAVSWGFAGRRQLREIDGVCIGPGGILQDSSSVWSLPGHLVLAQRAARTGAVVRGLGVGAEPLRRRSSAWLLRRAFAGSTVITRDEGSTSALEAAAVSATTGADVVFGLPLPDVARRSEIVVAVGPAVRPGRFSPAARRLDPIDPEAMAEVLDRLAARLQCTIALASFRGSRDRDAAEQLHGLLASESHVLPDSVDAHVEHTVGARLVVSSRYHPVVLAAASGTPALVVSDQAKVQSLCVQVGSSLVQRVSTWTDIADSDVPDVGEPFVPPELGRTHAGIDELLASAAANRTAGRLS